MGEIEDELGKMFKFASFSKGGNVGSIISTLAKSIQLSTLKQLRGQIDSMMKQITESMPNEGLDPYNILGVEPTANREEIEKAFKKKAWAAHPDRGGTNEEMVKVNAAYEAIKRVRVWK